MRYKILLLLVVSTCFLFCSALAESDVGTGICLEEALSAFGDDGKPEILYKGRTRVSLNMRSENDKNSTSLGVLKEGAIVHVFGFDQYWLYCWDEEVGVYFLIRAYVDIEETVSPDAAPYGVLQNRYVAVTSQDTIMRASPDENAEAIEEYPADTRLSIWYIRDGWAAIPYKRVVGYIYVGHLKELTPVSPTAEYAQDGDIIAAFTTFYSVDRTELNIGRMENIRVGCEYISKTYLPGEEFNFNQIAGPYRKTRGYMPSPVLIDGGTVAGYGGGTCQISTTLYNALLQACDGITILWRRPHGPGGAKYAPHGVDAAVGATNLNLIFRNDYDFPITIDSTVQNGSLCICIRKGAAGSAK